MRDGDGGMAALPNQPVAPKSGDERVVPIGAPLAEVLMQAMQGKLPAARVVLDANGRTKSRRPSRACGARAVSRAAALTPFATPKAGPRRDVMGDHQHQTQKRKSPRHSGCGGLLFFFGDVE